MAGDWIKIEIGLAEKPEIFTIARLLSIDRDRIVGLLVRFWSWADRNTVDGRVDGVALQDVDAVVDCPGFCLALSDVKWIIVDAKNNSVKIPKFDRHNGESVKKRLLASERQARWRSKKGETDVDVSVDAPPSTREEKRREVLLAPALKRSRGNGKLSEEAQTAHRSTWQAYSSAYFERYGTEPLRNAQANTLIAQFCRSVPMAEAPFIAEFYVRHNKFAYTNCRHDLKVMVAQAAALHTDWATGQQNTESAARKLDQGQAQGSVWAKLQSEGKT